MTTETELLLYGPFKLDLLTVVQMVTRIYPGVYILSRDGGSNRLCGTL